MLRDAVFERAGEPRLTIRDIPPPGEELDKSAIQAGWDEAERARRGGRAGRSAAEGEGGAVA